MKKIIHQLLDKEHDGCLIHVIQHKSFQGVREFMKNIGLPESAVTMSSYTKNTKIYVRPNATWDKRFSRVSFIWAHVDEKIWFDNK